MSSSNPGRSSFPPVIRTRACPRISILRTVQGFTDGVYYESHARIVDNIPVFHSFGEAAVASNFNCIFLLVMVETYRHYVRLSVSTDSSQSS
jgi:hypothetical protein